MTDFLGIDLPGILDEAFQSSAPVRDGLLLKRNDVLPSTTGELTGEGDPGETPHACRGFTEKSVRRQGTTAVQQGTHVVSIFGNSLPIGIVPAQDDRVQFEGITYVIVSTSVDPANALYECIAAGPTGA